MMLRCTSMTQKIWNAPAFFPETYWREKEKKNNEWPHGR